MTGFTHLDEAGAARMVDVGGKDVTARSASAAQAASRSGVAHQPPPAHSAER